MKKSLLLAVLLLASSLALPLASADHVFSHRAYVMGRVVDVHGDPVPATDVQVQFIGVPQGGRCYDSRVESTDTRGDFSICRHTHRLPEEVDVTLTVLGESFTFPYDTVLRRLSVQLVLEQMTPIYTVEGNRSFPETLLVTGRLFRMSPDPIVVEGIEVHGEPRAGETVHARLMSGDTILANETGRSNEHGDYMIDLAVRAIPDDARLVVNTTWMQRSVTDFSFTRRADVDLVYDPQAIAEPDVPPPGAAPPERVPLGAAVVLAAVGMAFVVHRKRQ